MRTHMLGRKQQGPPVRAPGNVTGAWARLKVFLFGFDAFISYAHKDALGYAMALENRLKVLDYTSFRDVQEMPAGTNLREAIQRGLRRSRLLIVLDTNGARASTSVKSEVTDYRALHRSARPIIGIKMDAHVEPWPEVEEHVYVDRDVGELDPPRPSDEVIARIMASRRRLLVNDLARLMALLVMAIVLALMLGMIRQFNQERAARQEAELMSRRRAAALASRAFSLSQPVRGEDSDDVVRRFLLALEAAQQTPPDDPHADSYRANLLGQLVQIPDRIIGTGGPKDYIHAVDRAGHMLAFKSLAGLEIWSLADAPSLRATVPFETDLELAGESGAFLAKAKDGATRYGRDGSTEHLPRLDGEYMFDSAGAIVERSIDAGKLRLKLQHSQPPSREYAWTPLIGEYGVPRLWFGPDAAHDWLVWIESGPAEQRLVVVRSAWHAEPQLIARGTTIRDVAISPAGSVVSALVEDGKQIGVVTVEPATLHTWKREVAVHKPVQLVTSDDGRWCAVCADGGRKQVCACSTDAADRPTTTLGFDRIEATAVPGHFVIRDDPDSAPYLWSATHDDEMWRAPPLPAGKYTLTGDGKALLALTRKGDVYRWDLERILRGELQRLDVEEVESAWFKSDCSSGLLRLESSAGKRIGRFSHAAAALTWSRVVYGQDSPMLEQDFVPSWSSDGRDVLIGERFAPEAALSIVLVREDSGETVAAMPDPGGRIIAGKLVASDWVAVVIESAGGDGVAFARWNPRTNAIDRFAALPGMFLGFSGDGLAGLVLVTPPDEDPNGIRVQLTDLRGAVLWTSLPGTLSARSIRSRFAAEMFARSSQVRPLDAATVAMTLPGGVIGRVSVRASDVSIQLDGEDAAIPRSGGEQLFAGTFAIAPTGRWFVGTHLGDANDSMRLKVWDTRAGTPTRELFARTNRVRGACGTRDGSQLRLVDSRGEIRSWLVYPLHFDSSRRWLQDVGVAFTGRRLVGENVVPVAADEVAVARLRLEAALRATPPDDQLAGAARDWSGLR